MAPATGVASADGRSVTRPAAAARVLASLCADMRRCLDRLAGSGTPAAVHDTRVAARRLRCVLSVLAPRGGRPAVAERRRRGARRAARMLALRLAASREADVRLALLTKALGTAAVSPELRRWLRAAAADVRARVRAELAGRLDPPPAYLAALLDPSLGAAIAPHLPSRARISRRAEARARRLRHRLRHCRGSARRLHRARLAVKRLRYVEDALGAWLVPPPPHRRGQALLRLQRRLGDYHDLWALREWLRQLASANGEIARNAADRRLQAELRLWLHGDLRRRLRAARKRAEERCARCAANGSLWT